MPSEPPAGDGERPEPTEPVAPPAGAAPAGPPPAGPPSTGAAQRLHPLSWLFALLRAARGLIVPLLAVIVLSGGSVAELWLAVLLVPTVATSLLRWYFYRYRLGPEELIIREGILARNERHIPYARIQNIDLVRNPLHRALEVADVRLETAGGDKPEAVMRVLSMEAVEEMRRRVFRQREAGEIAEAGATQERGGEPLVAMSPREVVLFGLISNRGMVVVGAFFGLLWQAGLLDRWTGEGADRVGSSWTDSLSIEGASEHLGVALLVGLALLLAALVLLRVLSVALALIRLYGFTLVRDGEDLRTEAGLLTRVTATVPRPRVQLLSDRQTLLHSWAGRTSVRVETAGAGGGSQEEGGRKREQWLAPLLRRERLAELVAEVLPGIDLSELEWRRLAASTAGRLARRRAIVALLGSLAFFRLGWLVVAVVALVGIGLAAVSAYLYARHAAWALSDRAVFFREGWLVRRMSMVRFEKIQVVSQATSPFDRYHGTVRVAVDTAGAGQVGHRVAVPFMPRDQARQLADRLTAEARRTRYRW